MTAENGCGTSREFGATQVVGVEDAFTGRGVDPAADPTGLGLLLAMIDGRYWPVHVCGDTGIGAPFTQNPVGVNQGGNVTTEFTPFGTPITAHGCLMNCDYRVTIDLNAEVIVAEIDGAWHILRVRSTAATFPTLGSSNDCRCCGLTPQRMKLYYRIMSVSPSGCGTVRACDEYTIVPGECVPSAGNPLSISVGCTSDWNSAFEEVADWVVTVCGVPATIVSLDCDAPSSTCVPTANVTAYSETCTCTGIDPDSYVTRLELYITAECDGCTYSIFIFSKLEEQNPCALEDVPIELVEMEACGHPNLTVGDRVIVAHVPIVGDDGYGTTCPQIEYFLIRACTSGDCADPCDTVLPGSCCGIPCANLPETMYALIELSYCDCDCSVTVPLTKMPCDPGSENGQWRYEVSLPVTGCETYVAYWQITSIVLMCGEPPYDGGTGFSIVANGYTGTMVSSVCVPGSMYFVFEFDFLPLCLDKTPGRVPADLLCRGRITITE